MELTLYKYAGRPEQINKVLENGNTLSGVLRNDFNFLNPEISIRSSQPVTENYCYIPDFKRYYFISGIIQRNKNEYEISLSVDVLMTYKSAILAATGTVTESANGDKFVSVRDVIYNKTPTLEKVAFPEQPLNNDGKIIMITLKGDSQL